MKKTFFILLIYGCGGLSVFSQAEAKFIMCGHEWMINSLESEYPGFNQEQKKAFEKARRDSRLSGQSLRNEMLTVPVVVHVVWKDEEENVSDELILRQFETLNAAFNLENDNRDNVRPVFKDLQANAQVVFDIQEIRRKETGANFALSFTLQLPDNVKNDRDGSPAVDPDKVLNIWICKLQPIPFIGGQILGYAYPPANLGNWPSGANAPSKDLDGVVLDYRALGPDNPIPLTVNGEPFVSEGLTMVHEIGHYLGLRHIWGDGNSLFGGSSCTEDDGVEDTPNQGRSSEFACNLTQNTCTDDTDDLPDMIENYMDYSTESCQSMFTEGQVYIMRAVLQFQRSGLTSRAENAFAGIGIDIFPNPVYDQLHITSDEVWQEGQILDMYGRVLATFYGHQNTIDVSHLIPATYILRLKGHGPSAHTSFVKY